MVSDISQLGSRLAYLRIAQNAEYTRFSRGGAHRKALLNPGNASTTNRLNIPSFKKLSSSFFPFTLNAYGVNLVDILRAQYKGMWKLCSSMLKIEKIEKLADISVKKRRGDGYIEATFEKIYEDDKFSYVIKDKNHKQLAVLFCSNDKTDNNIKMDYFTTFMGRDKYKQLECIIIYGMFEDIAARGKMLDFKGLGTNIGDISNRRISNTELYRRMGFTIDDNQTYNTRISSEKALKLAQDRAEKFGKIITEKPKIIYKKDV